MTFLDIYNLGWTGGGGTLVLDPRTICMSPRYPNFLNRIRKYTYQEVKIGKVDFWDVVTFFFSLGD